MDDPLFAFLAGFFVCAFGVLLALVLDIGMGRLPEWLRRFF